jgi:NADH-quinone oxidoreductase subunit L
MLEDKRSNIFFAYLSLFTFSMLGLVISPNLLEFYFFWELVGACSFLLIGFYYFKETAKQAAKKAFIVTRIGDVGLFIAICLTYWQVGSFDFDVIELAVSKDQLSAGMITLIALLIFVGAIGKSGQFPLHTWLPDAMEGPTPVSALIHAATMVAAGVFLIAKTFWLFAVSPTALTVVSYIGGFTALFAAIIALTQTDIKRVLAYSTVSQLGYMMLALGMLGYGASMFHLMTHAFFKALLFLAAGAVIVALKHEQDIRKMGGLWREQRGLGIAFLIGCLSISGIPPFSGFFSKDEIFLSVYQSGRIDLLIAAGLASFCTAFYIFRLFFLVFTGERRMQGEVQPLSWYFKVPIWILAVLSVIAGFIQYPKPIFSSWLETTHSSPVWWLPVLVTVIALFGFFLAFVIYQRNWISAESMRKSTGFGYQLSYRKFYIDECYQVVFVWSLKGLGWLLTGWDRFVIGGIARFMGMMAEELGQLGSKLQNGQVQRYILISIVGFLVLLITLTAGRLIE